jgi:hypothetical protein
LQTGLVLLFVYRNNFSVIINYLHDTISEDGKRSSEFGNVSLGYFGLEVKV